MSAINIHPLNGVCRIETGPRWAPARTIDASVDAIWSEEKKRLGDRLTNGRIYHLADFRADCLLIRPCEYRYALARRRVPDLVEAGLVIRPLAVTGVLTCAEGLVLGRRSDTVATDSGYWEPAPSGGISQPDLRAQIMEELEEELGLAASDIVSAEACGLVEDVASGVFDVVFRLRTTLNGKAIRAACGERGSDEYADLAIIEVADMPDFLQRESNRLLPTLRPMLSMSGLLAG